MAWSGSAERSLNTRWIVRMPQLPSCRPLGSDTGISSMKKMQAINKKLAGVDFPIEWESGKALQ